jgi:hypothetical protein
LALAFQHLIEMSRRRLVWVATRTPPPAADARSLVGVLTWLRWAKNWLLPVRPRRPIPPAVIRFLENACTEYRIRKGREHDEEALKHFEDKLLFTRSFFAEQAAAIGFDPVVIESLSESERQFSQQVRVMLRLGLALPETALPAWAWDHLRIMDRHFSRELMPELLCEGLVVFRKPVAGAARQAA